MSHASSRPLSDQRQFHSPVTRASQWWIINSWGDLFLILLTPLLAVPAVLMLYSPSVGGISAETISLIVTSLFATGHHLPGLIRAYGDSELFQRFRWRFLLAPPLVFLFYFPLFDYHYDLYRLLILCWATWHGLMQLYGFVRIYDAKVGSTSSTTAYWDWLVCLCGFITPQFIRPEKLSNILVYWYSFGGPLIPANVVENLQKLGLGICGVILIGFVVNYVIQTYQGSKPNPVKIVMLVSGIGLWWYTILAVENLVIGIALFDICHDVQYLAIVWLYNCRRVRTNPQLGGFMRYLFRRSMVLLYLGLIAVYGAMGLLAPLVADGTFSRILYGILFTSTILHYYYDGFIWKVRESVNQASLGLGRSGARLPLAQIGCRDLRHVIKWSTLMLAGGLLFATDMIAPPLSQARKTVLGDTYANQLLGNFLPPKSMNEQSWLFEQFQRTQSIAISVPADRYAGLRAAVMLANFGRNDEAVELLQRLVQRFPGFCEAYLTWGGIDLYRGNSVQAAASFVAAQERASTDVERANVNIKLGELHLYQGDRDSAKACFDEALRLKPSLSGAIEALYKNRKASNARR